MLVCVEEGRGERGQTRGLVLGPVDEGVRAGVILLVGCEVEIGTEGYTYLLRRSRRSFFFLVTPVGSSVLIARRILGSGKEIQGNFDVLSPENGIRHSTNDFPSSFSANRCSNPFPDFYQIVRWFIFELEIRYLPTMGPITSLPKPPNNTILTTQRSKD